MYRLNTSLEFRAKKIDTKKALDSCILEQWFHGDGCNRAVKEIESRGE